MFRSVFRSSQMLMAFSAWRCSFYSIARDCQVDQVSSLATYLFAVRRYALHGICDSNSVCLSVRLSVCLSHSWTVSTWFDLGSRFLDHMVAPSF